MIHLAISGVILAAAHLQKLFFYLNNFLMTCLRNNRKILLLLTFISLNYMNANAQQQRGNDTTYYIYFPGSITARLYSSQKYTSFTLKSKSAKDIRYRPNTSFNVGVGATYHNFSLNLAYGFGFLNNNAEKGKTKYLDLQSHFYTPKWVVDFDGQLYKGYHLNPRSFAAEPGKSYYYRGDVGVSLFGVSSYRIFNPRRFSYKAAFIQNEWQKKSAGTFLAGAEIYYGVVKGDSSFIPQSIAQNYMQPGAIKKINYFSLGPGAGYAYTLVVLQHIFFTGSLTGNLNFSFANEHVTENPRWHFSVNPVTRFRVATGYNSRSWNVSANWIEDYLPFQGASKENSYFFNTGNYRIIIAKRFNTGRRLQKHLAYINKIFKE
ncbi:MAG: DUF4421 domain-containing protein [Bacteroidota bacterium]|nr:DUF4421 domain-containing protein [Bacteroidota bacterium]